MRPWCSNIPAGTWHSSNWRAHSSSSFTLVLVSFLELYQDRLYALLNIYALHSLVLAASVAWQAFVQGGAHLYITATIALVFKAIVIPVALHRIIVRLGIHREIEKVAGGRHHDAGRNGAGGTGHGGYAAGDAGGRPISARRSCFRAFCRSPRLAD